MSESGFSWFVGVDWGEEKHQVCLSDATGKVRGSRKFSHTGAGLSALVEWLAKRTAASPEAVAVGIERPGGAVVATLLAAGHPVFSLNPRQSSRLREFYFHTGNKSDDVDAKVLAWGLRSSVAVFRRVGQYPELIQRLRERTRTAQRLTGQRVRLQQQIRNVLVDYFPQMLAIAGDMRNIGTPFFRQLWKRAPTPTKARRLHRGTVERLIREYGVKRISADRAFLLLREEALIVAPGVTEASVEQIETHLAVLEIVTAQIERAERQVIELLDEFRQTPEARDGLEPRRAEAVSGVAATSRSPENLDEPARPDVVSVLRSRRGLGNRAIASLLAWGYEPLMRGDYRTLRALCGVIPRQVQSGKSERSALRRAVPICLVQASYTMAMGVVRWDPKVAAYNRKLKAEGKRRARRYRSIANREIRVLCAMVRNRTYFAPDYPSQRQAA